MRAHAPTGMYMHTCIHTHQHVYVYVSVGACAHTRARIHVDGCTRIYLYNTKSIYVLQKF